MAEQQPSPKQYVEGLLEKTKDHPNKPVIIERAEIDQDGCLDILLERDNGDGTWTHWGGCIEPNSLRDILQSYLEEFDVIDLDDEEV